MDPKTLRYAETHEWAALAGDIVTVGVTAFAADQLGDVTLVEFRKPGTKVEAKGLARRDRGGQERQRRVRPSGRRDRRDERRRR